MKIGPTDSLGSPLNYDWATTGFNDWVDMNYTITQQRDIETSAGTISGLVVDQFAGETRELVDDFSTGKELMTMLAYRTPISVQKRTIIKTH